MLPQYLYKYRVLNEYSERIILNNKIYIPSPLEFNDPFDCQLNYGISTDENYLRKELWIFYQEKYPHASTEQLNEVINEHMGQGTHKDPVEWKQIVNDSMVSWLQRTGVYCLTESNDNILMWSHYSNGHKGFCLEFSLKSYLKATKKVVYQIEYPKLRYTGDDKNDTELINTVLLTKSDSWAYEKEWRIIETGGPGLYEIKDGELTGVIFGCKISRADRKRIISLIQKRSDPLRLSEAHEKQSEFGLDIVQI